MLDSYTIKEIKFANTYLFGLAAPSANKLYLNFRNRVMFNLPILTAMRGDNVRRVKLRELGTRTVGRLGLDPDQETPVCIWFYIGTKRHSSHHFEDHLHNIQPG